MLPVPPGRDSAYKTSPADLKARPFISTLNLDRPFAMDVSLFGQWLVRDIEMTPDRTLTLIGGLPGQVVEFTAEGEYNLWGNPKRPDLGRLRYRLHDTDPAGLDVWIPGLEPLVRLCLYRVSGSTAEICINGGKGPRPTEIRRDDERSWALVKLDRWTGPPVKERVPRAGGKRKPRKLIPEGFLGEG